MWKSIIGKIDKILNAVRGVADTVITNDEERGRIVEDIESIRADVELGYQAILTERHQNDMNSDSWLSKNIRPLVLIFLLLAFAVFTSLDGAGLIVVAPEYISLIKEWGAIALMFYFGSRGIEKVTRISDNIFRKKRKNKE
jgi:hypothetical protein